MGSTSAITKKPLTRPGGRSARVRRAVFDAALELLDEREAEITVARLADRAGVSEVTIYRRWGDPQSVALEAVVDEVNRRLPIVASGDLQADLTLWASRLERSIATPRGRRLLEAVVAARGVASEETVRQLGMGRVTLIRALIDAAVPPAAITVEEVFDRVLAPLYMRQLFGYAPETRPPSVLVEELLRGHEAQPKGQTGGKRGHGCVTDKQ